jgi:hypothetical protein
VENNLWTSFLRMLSKRETCVPKIRDVCCISASPFSSDMRSALHGRVSLILYQKLNNC